MTDNHDLDAFANLYLDAIMYREEKAGLQVKLGENEMEAVKFMRERLMQYLANKYSLSSETHDFAVNTKERKLIVALKAQAPEPAEGGQASLDS